MHGITVGLKDIYLTEGKVTEGNSTLYTGFVPGFDAESVARLKAGGSVILGKVGTSELATATASAGRTTPGTCCARRAGRAPAPRAGVGASEFMLGMGTCTGGSIRGPAANNGICGFKPTYGTVSLHGIFPLGLVDGPPGSAARTPPSTAPWSRT